VRDQIRRLADVESQYATPTMRTPEEELQYAMAMAQAQNWMPELNQAIPLGGRRAEESMWDYENRLSAQRAGYGTYAGPDPLGFMRDESLRKEHAWELGRIPYTQYAQGPEGWDPRYIAQHTPSLQQWQRLGQAPYLSPAVKMDADYLKGLWGAIQPSVAQIFPTQASNVPSVIPTVAEAVGESPARYGLWAPGATASGQGWSFSPRWA